MSEKGSSENNRVLKILRTDQTSRTFLVSKNLGYATHTSGGKFPSSRKFHGNLKIVRAIFIQAESKVHWVNKFNYVSLMTH